MPQYDMEWHNVDGGRVAEGAYTLAECMSKFHWLAGDDHCDIIHCAVYITDRVRCKVAEFSRDPHDYGMDVDPLMSQCGAFEFCGAWFQWVVREVPQLDSYGGDTGKTVTVAHCYPVETIWSPYSKGQRKVAELLDIDIHGYNPTRRQDFDDYLSLAYAIRKCSELNHGELVAAGIYSALTPEELVLLDKLLERIDNPNGR